MVKCKLTKNYYLNSAICLHVDPVSIVFACGSVIICEKMPEISAEEDLLTWWRTHETTFTSTLPSFAKKYLCFKFSVKSVYLVHLPQDIFVHIKYTSLSVLDVLYLSLNKNNNIYPLNIVAVFFSVVSKMVSNIDIFQGIVSKLEIPVS